MVNRKKTREEWEQEVRERQYNVDPMDRLRTIQHINRNLPAGSSLIRGRRELLRFLLGLVLCASGTAIAMLAYGARLVLPSVWIATGAIIVGVLVAVAGVFSAVSSIG
jgi:hypothetical protein